MTIPSLSISSTVCMYILSHTYTNINIHVPIYVCVCVCIYIYIYIYTNKYTSTIWSLLMTIPSLSISLTVCMYILSHIYTNIYIHVPICVCVYIYIYIYTNKHRSTIWSCLMPIPSLSISSAQRPIELSSKHPSSFITCEVCVAGCVAWCVAGCVAVYIAVYVAICVSCLRKTPAPSSPA